MRPCGSPGLECASRLLRHLLGPSRRPRWVPPVVAVRSDSLCLSGSAPGLVAARTGEHAPGDAGQLVGKRHGQDITVQSLGRRMQPGAEAVLGPVLRSEQDHPGAADKQRAEIGVAALGDAPEDTSPGTSEFSCAYW